MTTVFLDIETCPSQDIEVLDGFRNQFFENFKAPSTLTREQAAIDLGITDKDRIKFTSKESMIAEWSERFKVEASEASAQELWCKTSFDGALGHICAIGYAFDDEPTQCIYSHNWLDDESHNLRMFFHLLDEKLAEHPNVRPVFVGHNILAFDFRFMFHRAVMLGVKPSRHIPFTASAWDDSVYDTMTRWAGRVGTIKQDKLARLLGGKGKGEIDGSMVWDYVRDGRIADVAKYCEDDVSDCRIIYNRMTFAPTSQVNDENDLPF
jgi:3'-5' exonuclease